MDRKKQIIATAIAICIVVPAALISMRMQGKQDANGYECTTYAMGTCFQQSVYGGNAPAAAMAASQRITDLEDRISWKIKDSDIAHLHRAAGSGEIAVHPETAALLRLSLEIAGESGGAYDPTVLPLSSLWNFDSGSQKVPPGSAVEKARSFVNYRDLQVDRTANTASLRRAEMGVDLGGIGKGAACDDAVAAYRSAKAESGIVSAGGSSIGLFGKKADGSPWRIAVRDPSTPDSDAGSMGVLSIDSGFLSTSGVYEKCFRQNDVLYHHLLDPATGYPEHNGLVSVTVVADGGALSDGLSTACFILGKEKSAALLSRYKAGAILIDQDNHVYVTDNLKGKFEIINRKYENASF